MEKFFEVFFGRIFWEDFLRGFIWEEFFGRNYFVDFYKELMFLSRFWGNFVSMEGRRKKEDFRSLEVQHKLIALKNFKFNLCMDTLVIYKLCLLIVVMVVMTTLMAVI